MRGGQLFTRGGQGFGACVRCHASPAGAGGAAAPAVAGGAEFVGKDGGGIQDEIADGQCAGAEGASTVAGTADIDGAVVTPPTEVPTLTNQSQPQPAEPSLLDTL